MLYKGTIDTNLLVLFLSQNNPEKRQLFKDLIKNTEKEGKVLFIPFIVIVELAYVLERIYKLSKTDVKKLIESLSALPVDIENKSILNQTLDIYVNTKLKFGDAMILAASKLKGSLPVFTYDKDFAKENNGVTLLAD